MQFGSEEYNKAGTQSGGSHKDVFQGQMFFSTGCNRSPIFPAVLKAGQCMSAYWGEGCFLMKFSAFQWLFQESDVPSEDVSLGVHFQLR